MIWNELMTMKPRLNNIRKLSLEEFLENYSILKVSGNFELYQDYMRKEKRIIKRHGEVFLKALLKLEETELNGEETNA